jgi:oligopeptide transport system substrate-binding protein
VSPDGRIYTFHLRPGTQWSNGEPVVAGDFIESWRRVLTPASAAPKPPLFFAVKNAEAYYRGAIHDFSAVGFQAPDANTIVITLEHPSAVFPLYVASGPWIPINRRAVSEFGRRATQPEHFVGNGPFTLTEWSPQQRIVVKKNPRYWDAEHIRTGEIQFIRFDNKDAEERAYRGGQIDVTMAVPEAKLDGYARERPNELHRLALAETRFLAFNLAKTPLSDVRVRRALSLAIDREKLVNLVLRGGQEAATRFLSPALLDRGRGRSLPRQARDGELVEPGSGPELQGTSAIRADDGQTQGRPEVGPYPQTSVHHFDPDSARRLLADACFPAGEGFPHLEISGWDRNPVLEAMQQMWKDELGITVGVNVREAKVHVAALQSGDYDIAFVTTLLDVRDPTSALADFTTSAANNFPHWNSPEFDRLIDEAADRTAISDARRIDDQAEQVLLEAAPVAPLYWNTQNWLMSPRVHGWEQDPLWTRRYNDVWIER